MTGPILSAGGWGSYRRTWDMEQLAHHWGATQRAYGRAMMEAAHA